MTNNAKVKAPKKKKNASLDRRKARAGWFFVLPFVISFVLIYLPIVFDSIRYSFSTLTRRPGQPMLVEWVGWGNYNDALFGTASTAGGGTFVQVLIQGMKNMVFDIPMILIFSLFMAVLLNQKMAGRAAFRAILFVPVIISTGIMDMGTAMAEELSSDSSMNDGSGGSAGTEIVSALDIQVWFSGMVIGDGLVTYVTTAINNIFNIVNHSGVQILIFLAGLQSISPAIYESVQIDGASAWETFWKITFPMISPMILVNAVYTVIDSFTMKSNVVMTFIETTYTSPMGGAEPATAMAWMYFLLVIGIIGLVAGICSAFIFYQRRD